MRRLLPLLLALALIPAACRQQPEGEIKVVVIGAEPKLRDPADGPKLIFRTTKARVAVGLPENTPPGEIAQLIAVLATPQVGEEAGETQRLVADLALRLNNPAETQRAKAALTQYLRATDPPNIRRITG